MILTWALNDALMCGTLFKGDEGGVAYVEENADALGRKTASYQDYVDLWVRIMDPTKIKVIFTFPFRIPIPCSYSIFLSGTGFFFLGSRNKKSPSSDHL